jgi:hypothetical protein
MIDVNQFDMKIESIIKGYLKHIEWIIALKFIVLSCVWIQGGV